MTEGAQFVAGGIFLAGAFAAHVLDYIQTVEAYDKGFKEVGFLAGPVVKKWGEGALPAFTIITSFAMLVGAAIAGTIGSDVFIAYTAPLCAGLIANNIRNYFIMKKK